MSRAQTLLIWFSLTLVVSLGLYHTSVRVQELSRNLRTLNREITQEQRNIHVLKAEWVYLSNPARIEAEAKKHLKLAPTKPQQIADATALKKLAGMLNARLAAATPPTAPKFRQTAQNLLEASSGATP